MRRPLAAALAALAVVATALVQDEIDALETLFADTGGATWVHSDGWGGPNGPCSGWWGVQCDVDGAHVVALNLSSNQLQNKLPDYLFGAFSELRSLDLHDNNLEGELPSAAELGGGALQVLLLNANFLQGCVPSELGSLRNLIELDLSDNSLSCELPSSLGALRTLRELRLQSNYISGAVGPWVGAMSELRVLRLAPNPLGGTLPPELGALSMLRELRFWGSALSGELPPELGALGALEILDLGANLLSGQVPQSFAGLRSLNLLDLSGNALSGGLAWLTRMGALHTARLGTNSLSGALPVDLDALSDLQYLDLSNNALSGALPASLGNMHSLTYLNLAANQLSGDVTGLLANMTSLETVVLARNRFSGRVLRDLSAIRGLVAVDMSENDLEDDFGASLPWVSTSLSSVALGGNPRIRGNVSDAFGMLRASGNTLRFLLLYGNGVGGEISDEVLSPFRRLGTVDLADCNVSGSVQPLLDVPSMRVLRLAGNRFSRISDQGTLRPSNLTTVDLARNAFESPDLCELLASLAYATSMRNTYSQIWARNATTSGLSRIDLSGNNLTRMAYYYSIQRQTFRPCYVIGQDIAFPSLLVLNVSNNALADSGQRLRAVMTSTLSSGGATSSAQNPKRIAVMGNDGLELQFLRSLRWVSPLNFFSEARFLCSQPYVADFNVALDAEPSQFNYSHCICTSTESSAAVFLPAVRRCMVIGSELQAAAYYSTDIDLDRVALTVRAGYYPVVGGGRVLAGRALQVRSFNEISVLRCRSESVCNPAWKEAPEQPIAYSFECASHRDASSLLCSRCDDGYFELGSSCRRCFGGSSVVMALLGLTFGALAVLWVWQRDFPDESATIPICLFYLQLSEALETSLGPEDDDQTAVALGQTVSGLLYFRPLLPECIFGTSNLALSMVTFWTSLPFVVVFVFTGIAAVLVRLGGPRTEIFRKTVSRCTCALLLIYLPVARTALQSFNRESQGGLSFLAAAPYVAWNSASHRAMIALSVVSLVTFIVPFPVVLLCQSHRVIKLWRAAIKIRRRAIEAASADDVDAEEQCAGSWEDETHEMIGLLDPSFLFASVRNVERFWLWEPLIVNTRRLLVACMVSLLPLQSQWLPFLLLLFLILSILTTALLQPYLRRVDNVAETALLTCAAALFAGNVATSSSSFLSGGALTVALTAGGSLVKAGVLAAMALSLFGRAHRASRSLLRLDRRRSDDKARPLLLRSTM